jgi:hypothetical protein
MSASEAKNSNPGCNVLLSGSEAKLSAKCQSDRHFFLASGNPV